MSSKTKSPFGSWKSPISSQLATEASVSFQELHVDKHSEQGNVFWTEMRCEEGGRYVVCSAGNSDSDYTSWTPSDMNARTKVHEYGGGATAVYGGKVFFSNFDDQNMYVQNSPQDKPTLLSRSKEKCRYADAEYHPKNDLVYCVMEDHSKVDGKTVKEPQNCVVCINPSSGEIQVLISGCDFYSSPRVSPNGKSIAWMQWNHPNMPWDTSEICMADLSSDGNSLMEASIKKVAGGGNDSVTHPRWNEKNELLYICDKTNWWNLYHVAANGEHVNLRQVNQEIGTPHWTFAYYSYDIDMSGSGNIVTVFAGELGILNINSKEYKKIDTGYQSHICVQYGKDGNIYCIAGGPKSFRSIIKVDPISGQVSVLRKSKSLSIDTEYLSVPEKISWTTGNGEKSYGYLYLPTNKDFEGLDGERPPLLVKAHGGPTSAASSILELKIQYFTSRGFAILDMDYRGSTGYGKEYRHKLRGNWGISDVEDASFGAKHLAETGVVDENKLCIDGGSAGGYTTLACLTFTDVFKAGASHYGIGNLETLAAETHKFESRYCDNLLAPLNEENMHIFNSRSPIKHIDKLNCAIALFQGDEDEVVPPNQAEAMFEAVKNKGLPCAYVLFKGEQHGFRKAENIQAALDGEFYFFSKVLGFKAADNVGVIPIENL